jgi:hypothetical protein
LQRPSGPSRMMRNRSVCRMSFSIESKNNRNKKDSLTTSLF